MNMLDLLLNKYHFFFEMTNVSLTKPHELRKIGSNVFSVSNYKIYFMHVIKYNCLSFLFNWFCILFKNFNCTFGPLFYQTHENGPPIFWYFVIILYLLQFLSKSIFNHKKRSWILREVLLLGPKITIFRPKIKIDTNITSNQNVCFLNRGTIF